MSFGFSVSDILLAIEHVNNIRKVFVDAPGQFNDVADEYVLSLGVVERY